MPRIPEETQKKIFLALLREVRERQGMTQGGLAELLNVLGQPEISKVERGVRGLDVLELRAWVKALAMPLPEFAAELEGRLVRAERTEARLRRRTNADTA